MCIVYQPFCTCSSYFYCLTKYYGMDLSEHFILKNPYGLNCIQTSKQEIELSEFLKHTLEDGAVKNKFNSLPKKLRYGKNKKIQPDIIIYPSKQAKKKGFKKEVIYFQGCIGEIYLIH